MPVAIGWVEGVAATVEIGHGGGGFSFDCEGPRHAVLLHPHALADRTVTNGEWAAFIEDGGYAESRHWLSDGWAWVQAEHIVAPRSEEHTSELQSLMLISYAVFCL